MEKLPQFKQPDSSYFSQIWTKNAAGFIVISCVFKRTIGKYQDRGYRYVLLEAGHAAQNIYLVSAGLKLSCCAIGGFTDNLLDESLDIDGVDESVLYILAIG